MQNKESAKFQPRSEKLPPISELEAIAIVTSTDVENAIEAFKDDSPEEEFEELLSAE